MKFLSNKIGELFILNPAKKEAYYKLRSCDPVSFIPMEDLGILTPKLHLKQTRKLSDVAGSYTYFANGDVLLAKITPCFENGKLGIAQNLQNDIGFGSSEYIVLRSKEKIIPEYLFYYLSQDVIRTEGKRVMSGAVGHKRVPKEFIENQVLNYPESIDEQKRIVSILDDAFAAIDKAKENTEKNLKNADELFESYLQAVFRSPEGKTDRVTLKDICRITSSLVDPRKSEWIEMPHVGAGNIESKSGLLTDIKTAKEEKLISGKYTFDNQMILYSKIRPYLMKVVRPDFSGLCSADIYPLHPNAKRLNRDYLYYLLLSEDFTTYAIQGSDRAGMPKVNRVHLFAYSFLLPTLDYQNRSANKLDELAIKRTKLQSLYAQKLSLLGELKQSLLKKAFRGEL